MDEIEFRKTADYVKQQLKMMSEGQFEDFDDIDSLFNDIQNDVFDQLDNASDEQLFEDEPSDSAESDETVSNDTAEDTESDANEKQRAEEFFSEDELDEADKINAYSFLVSEEDNLEDFETLGSDVSEEDDQQEDDLFNQYFGED